jgi:hypothetical protein
MCNASDVCDEVVVQLELCQAVQALQAVDLGYAFVTEHQALNF